MTDTVSWTEPLGSTRERVFLGIECRRGNGDERGVACMGKARCVPVRGGRCAHYGRGVNGGQRVRPRRARARSAPARLGGWRGWGRERGGGHGGRWGCGASTATTRSVPRRHCGQRWMSMRAMRCQKAMTDSVGAAVLAGAAQDTSQRIRAPHTHFRSITVAGRRGSDHHREAV